MSTSFVIVDWLRSLWAGLPESRPSSITVLLPGSTFHADQPLSRHLRVCLKQNIRSISRFGKQRPRGLHGAPPPPGPAWVNLSCWRAGAATVFREGKSSNAYHPYRFAAITPSRAECGQVALMGALAPGPVYPGTPRKPHETLFRHPAPPLREGAPYLNHV